MNKINNINSKQNIKYEPYIKYCNILLEKIGNINLLYKNYNNVNKKIANYLIFSISSDFGIALANNWLDNGHVVIGTYRNFNDRLKELENKGAILFKCDLASSLDIDNACINTKKN